MLSPGEVIKPHVMAESVQDLVKSLYGLQVTSVRELESYDDKNFYIKANQNFVPSHFNDVWPHGYVVKILNSMDSKNHEIVDGQNQIMLYLYHHGFNVSHPVCNLYGQYMKKESFYVASSTDNLKHAHKMDEYMVRLIKYISGKVLCSVPCTKELIYECGAYFAKLDTVLENFENKSLASRKTIWMLSSVPQLWDFVQYIGDKEKISLIENVLHSWSEKVLPIMQDLPKGFIHGDLNENNIIVTEYPDKENRYHVYGIIDFGDVSVNPYIFELAILITYVMLIEKTMGYVEAGGHAIAGYLSQRSLSNTELDILKECIAGRFAQSLVLGAYTYSTHPQNEYVLTTAKRGWNILKEFWETPKEDILAVWRSVMDTYS